jgi:hypothetical protein
VWTQKIPYSLIFDLCSLILDSWLWILHSRFSILHPWFLIFDSQTSLFELVKWQLIIEIH